MALRRLRAEQADLLFDAGLLPPEPEVSAGPSTTPTTPGAGNGPFGMGWSLSIPSIKRKSDRGLPGVVDHRAPWLVTHPLAELVATRVFLLAQGWRDQDDATALRDDPALRLAVSSRGGVRALEPRETALTPDRLASQPTLSRLQAMLASEHNRRALARGLCALSLRRMASEYGRRREMTIDVDSFAEETHGRQDGASWNGHYRMECFHPLIALADTGDLLGVTIRPGNVHTAHDVRRFIRPILDQAQQAADKVWLRFDAGFSAGKLFAWLDHRGVRFIARIRSNAALHRVVAAWRKKAADGWASSPATDGRPREATREFWYRAKGWTRVHRVVAVVVERDVGELFHHAFFLVTNASAVPRLR